MSDSEQKLRQALMKIAEAAQAAVENGQYADDDNGKNGETGGHLGPSHVDAGGEKGALSAQPHPPPPARKNPKKGGSPKPPETTQLSAHSPGARRAPRCP